MMPDEERQSQSLSEGIFDSIEYEAQKSPIKEFKPWHKPRKQFVRTKQWYEQIRKLLPEIESEVHGNRGGRPLKYLGLPGTDLLDLRFFHEQICKPKEIYLYFLGFNIAAQPQNPEQVELNISLDEVRKLPFVYSGSDVIPDDFRQIGIETSLAWKKTLDAGPYDVVNLDLCDGFAADTPGNVDATLYKAITALMSLQARKKIPWLFLITTRVGRDHIDGDALENFLQKYIRNLSEGPEFRDASSEYFSVENEVALRRTIETGKGLADVYLTGLCKWLIGLALTLRPQVHAELKSAVGYNVRENCGMDLVSLAIKFTPVHSPVEDPAGLAGLPAELSLESGLASKLPKRIANRRDVDTLLAEDNGLFQEMLEAQAGLLELARYDVAEYRVWAAQRSLLLPVSGASTKI